MTSDYLSQSRRNLVELLHHAPGATITVKLSGDPGSYTVTTGRDDALALARAIAGDNCVVLESLGARRKRP